jgi:antitoxin YefM
VLSIAKRITRELPAVSASYFANTRKLN